MNNKNSLLLVDPEFDPGAVSDCTLLVKVTPDSFSYAIINKKIKQLLAVFDHQQCADVISDLSLRFKNDPYLALSFLEVKVSVYTANTLAIPDELFNPEDLDVYKKFFTEEVTQIYTRPVASFGFTSIFSLRKFVDEKLNTHLASAKKYEHGAPVFSLAKHIEGHALILDFTAASFNVLYKKDNKIIFQNCYETENAEEFNYYLVLIIKQLHIHLSDTPVYLSGIIHQDDAFYNCVKKYFSTIHFNTPPVKDVDNKILDDMPAHYYSSLLALDLCE